jgi:hypothetical protein
VNRDVVENACSECSNDGTRPSTSSNGFIGQTPPKPAAEKTKGLAGPPRPLLLAFDLWDYVVESIGHNCRARKMSRHYVILAWSTRLLRELIEKYSTSPALRSTLMPSRNEIDH